jgi:uncharacterized protein (TIGR02001 family)
MSKIALLTLATAAFAAPALAQSEAGPGSWAFAIGGATDNRSKNASKTQGDAFVYGLVEWESDDSFVYAGTGAETIDSNGSNVEHDLKVGIRPTVAGFDVDLNVAHKWQIDADPGTDNDALEFTANVSRSIGPASARVQLQHSPNGTGATEAWTWVEARVGWDFTNKLSADASIGRREQDNNIDYTGWNAGVTYAVNDRLELDLRWHDTDADVPGPQYEGALVAGVNLYF